MEMKSGIVGLTSSFKEAVNGLRPGEKVVFAGSVAVCTPFSELLAYAVKDMGLEMVYAPKARADLAKRMKWVEDVGYSVTSEPGETAGATLVVILGGLAMPKFGCSTAEVNDLISNVSEQRPKVVGVCFMNIFERAGWTEQVCFDTVINATMDVTVVQR